MRRRRPINPRFENFGVSDITRVPLKTTENYHKNKSKIPKVVLSVTERHEIIHGEQAVKKQVPGFLRRHTHDFDIFSKTPMVDAMEAEKALDKAFGMDAFVVTPGKHVGTARVVSRATGEAVVDYTKPPKKITSKKINGHRYASLEYMEKQAIRILNDPLSAHRHPKDRDTVNRIRIAKRRKK